MKSKAFSIVAIIIALASWVQGQSNRPYVIQNGDTIPCKSISFGYSRRGALEFAQYIDAEGRKVRSEAEQGLPNVTSFFSKDTVFDRVPIFADKTDGPVWYAPRMADGKIKLYFVNTTYVYNDAGNTGGYYRFTFQMPDGNFYKVTQGNVNKVIKPYVQQCKNFTERYKGNYKADETSFYELITIYNAQCK